MGKILQYVPTVPKWAVSKRIGEDGHTYTRFANGFEACTLYDSQLSRAEEYNPNKPLACKRWKPKSHIKDWRTVVGKNKFSKYRTVPKFSHKPGESIYAWWYDLDYTIERGEVLINAYGVTEEGTPLVTRMSGFYPYIYVGVPDSWIETLEKNGVTGEAQMRQLNLMVEELHKQLEFTLKSRHGDSWKTQNLSSMLRPLSADGQHVVEIKDALGYSGNCTTKAFRLETTNPQLIPKLRELLYNPHGGRGDYGNWVTEWYDNIMLPEPNGVTTIARSDRIWLANMREKEEAAGRTFDQYNYFKHEERNLYYEFHKPGEFGTDKRFTVYEANVDFIVRYIVDTQNVLGWVKIDRWVQLSHREKFSTLDVEIGIDYRDAKRIADPAQTVDIDKTTREYVRPLTDEEKKGAQLYEKPANLMYGYFDAEMISRRGQFPDPRYCPITHWGVRAKNAQTEKTHNYYFILGSPAGVNEGRNHDPDNPKDHFSAKRDKCKENYMWTIEDEDSTYFYYYNESDMIRDIMLFYAEMRFQKVSGWNIEAFDIAYIITRAQHLGITEAKNFLQVNPWKTTSWKDSYIKNRSKTATQVSGTIVEDLMQFMREQHNSWPSHSLNAAADQLLGDKKVELAYELLEAYQHLSRLTQAAIVSYLEGDITLPDRCAVKDSVDDTQNGFVQVQYCTFKHLLSRGAQLKVFAGILGELHKVSEKAGIRVLLPWFPRKSKEDFQEKYIGAHVFPPKRGFYDVDDPVATLDYSSLYPSIMMMHNMCYSSLITLWAIQKFGLKAKKHYWQCPEYKINKDGTLHVFDDSNGYGFILEDIHEGYIPNLERNLKKFRNKAKFVMNSAEAKAERCELDISSIEADIRAIEREAKAGDDDNAQDDTQHVTKRRRTSHETQVEHREKVQNLRRKVSAIRDEISTQKAQESKYNALQLSIKIYMNSIYGFFGATDSLAILKPAAKSITTMGQIYIKQAQIYVETHCTVKNGFPGDAQVIYGDTDSIMFRLLWAEGKVPNRDEFIEIAKHMSTRVTKDVFDGKLVILFEKIYVPYLLLMKKRYAGLKFEGGMAKLTYMGVKPKRKDTTKLLNNAFFIMLNEAILIGDIQSAEEKITEIFECLARREVSYADIMSSCSLKKDLSECYEPSPKTGRVSVTFGMRCAENLQKRTGKESHGGDRFSYAIRSPLNVGAKKTHEKTMDKVEDPVHMLRENIPYDINYYAKNIATNMIQPMQYMTEGEEYLREKWLKCEGMKRNIRQINDDTALGKMNLKRIKLNCRLCSAPLNNATAVSKGIASSTHINEKTHVVIHYDGVEDNEQHECDVSTEYQRTLCTDCARRFDKKYYDKTSFDHAMLRYLEKWNVCQTCPSKLMEGDIITHCTNADCRNFYERTETERQFTAAWNALCEYEW